MEQQELVAFTAKKHDRIFSWDIAPAVAMSLRSYFEAEGWEVSLAIGEGPRRRHFPRIVRG